jgi:hypothetical protein
VLEFAFRQASLRDLPLRVVHYVMDPRSALVGVPMVGDLSVQMEEDELALSEAMAGMRERYPDVRATVQLSPGARAARRRDRGEPGRPARRGHPPTALRPTGCWSARSRPLSSSTPRARWPSSR